MTQKSKSTDKTTAAVPALPTEIVELTGEVQRLLDKRARVNAAISKADDDAAEAATAVETARRRLTDAEIEAEIAEPGDPASDVARLRQAYDEAQEASQHARDRADRLRASAVQFDQPLVDTFEKLRTAAVQFGTELQRAHHRKFLEALRLADQQRYVMYAIARAFDLGNEHRLSAMEVQDPIEIEPVFHEAIWHRPDNPYLRYREECPEAAQIEDAFADFAGLYFNARSEAVSAERKLERARWRAEEQQEEAERRASHGGTTIRQPAGSSAHGRGGERSTPQPRPSNGMGLGDFARARQRGAE